MKHGHEKSRFGLGLFWIGLPLLGVAAAVAQLPGPAQLSTQQPKTMPGQVAPPAAPVVLDDRNGQQEERGVTFSTSIRSVLAPTTVTDKAGNYIDGLDVKDFALYDNDKLQAIDSEIVTQPLSVVLAVQANNEVEPMLKKMKNAGILLHGLVTGQDGDVAILAFDHRMRLMQDFTSDPDRLDSAMNKITAGSSTAAIIDAVLESDRMLIRHDSRPAHRRHVILLLSRDVDKGSTAKLEETVKKMQFDNVVIYCVDISKFLAALMKKPDFPRPANGGIPAVAMPNARGNTTDETMVMQNSQLGNAMELVPLTYHTIHDLFKRTPAEAFTRFTGAHPAYHFNSQKDLEAAISDIGKELRTQYMLSYTPNDQLDPGFHTIKVVVNRNDLIVRTRPGYFWGGGKQ